MLDDIVFEKAEADRIALSRQRVVPDIPIPDGVLLRASGIEVTFGGVKALAGVSFEVAPGQVYAIIGPNGAGKTTLLNVVSGVYAPSSGQLTVRGIDLTRFGVKSRASLRVGRTFQSPTLFKGMTVLENILIGRHSHMRAGLISCAAFWGPARAEERLQRKRAGEILKFLGLDAIKDAQVDALPYGLQKRVELGRALALEPELLLLDEPMAGMTPGEKKEMVQLIRELNRSHGITVILIEHDMGVVMKISQRILVLDHGMRIAEGSPAEVASDPTVIAAYLGQD
jgi:branched-chain amino acid transport system ATP-binding protein